VTNTQANLLIGENIQSRGNGEMQMRSHHGGAAQLALRLSTLAIVCLLAPGAHALEEQRGEAAAIEACDKRLCTILMQKNPKGDDLRCSLTKTWARSTIKEADSHKLRWAFGDARCSVDVNLNRAHLVAVITGDGRKFFVRRHTVNCVVEQDGRLEKVTATLAPKIEFKDGKADKVWVNLKDVDGPAGIKATLLTAAQLADGLGLFHRRMIKSINRYIERHCPKTYPQLVSTAPQPPAKARPEKK
jgi:hypothetical protein